MTLTLTLWQRVATRYPTQAGQDRLEEPSLEAFAETVARLMTQVEPNAVPFQIVAQIGDSSRAFQLDRGWTCERIAAELWPRYRGLIAVNG